jgi:broad specificity phosphatase PhoE
MAKTIVLVRHTDNDDDVLSSEGVTAAVELGATLQGDSFDLAVSTGAQRATQTVACILAGMGRPVVGGVVVEPQLRSTIEDRWRDAYQRAGGNRIADFRRVAPSLLAEDSALLADGLRGVIRRLDEGQRALVVGHSPTNEAAVYGLTGTEIDPMGKGEAVELTIDGDKATVTAR